MEISGSITAAGLTTISTPVITTIGVIVLGSAFIGFLVSAISNSKTTETSCKVPNKFFKRAYVSKKIIN